VIDADKRGPLGWLAARYVDWRLRRDFRGVWVRGQLPERDDGLLAYANHPGWWDGFALHALCRAAARDGYCLVEERNLARFPFLRRVGAFSIRRGDPRSAVESLGRARRLLARPRAVVVVFPQGALTPQAAPPLHLERGVEVLARRAAATCVPVGLRYAFFEDPRPDLLIEVGAAHPASSLERFGAGLDATVAALGRARSLQGFRPLGRPGDALSRPPIP
jgi:1-acyl-sn-glycerol-3-phosphate acyltransferase